MLAGQALKAIYKVKSNLIKFPGTTVQHKLDLFDKLSLPILKYGLEVWGLNDSPDQNHFVYVELGRTSLKSRRGVNVIR